MLITAFSSFFKRVQQLSSRRRAGDKRPRRRIASFPLGLVAVQTECLEQRALLTSLSTVTTPTATDVTSGGAMLGGNVVADGGSPITERGVVYARTSDNANPQLDGTGVTHVTASGTTGTFITSETSLTPATGYSFDAYATNANGTSYSAVATFTTNVAPTLSGFSGGQTYVQGSAPLALDPNLVVTDPASSQLSSATVSFNNWQAGDRLDFVNMFAIGSNGQHTFSEDLVAHTATLTINGSGTLSDYQNTLRSITFHNVAGAPVTTARTANIVVNDGVTNSNTVSGTVDVQLANQPPVLSAIESAPLTYVANHPQIPISSTLAAGDPDSNNLSNATVQITSGYQNNANGHDLLSFVNQNGITGSFVAATGTLTLTGTSSVSNYRAALRSVMFSSSGLAVNSTTRTLTLTAMDDHSPTPATSASISRDVTVTTTNVAPTLSGFSGAQTYIQGSAPLALDPNLVVSDAASSQLSSATVSFTNWQPGDRLDFVNMFAIGSNGQHTFSEDLVAHTATLTINGPGTLSDYQATLRSITFHNVAGAPVTTARTANIVVNDGVTNSNTVSGTVDVQLANQPPVLSAIETTPLMYTANQPGVSISSTLAVGDPDSNNLSAAIVQITAGYQNNLIGHDILSVVNQNGITGSFDASTGTLTLTGISSVSNYREALRSVMFSASGVGVNKATRTLTVTVMDDHTPTPATSASISRDVVVS